MVSTALWGRGEACRDRDSALRVHELTLSCSRACAWTLQGRQRGDEAEGTIARLQDEVAALKKELDAASDADARQLVRCAVGQLCVVLACTWQDLTVGAW